MIFENNQTLGFFIRSVLEFLLLLAVNHRCSRFSLNFPSEKHSLRDLLSLLSPHIDAMRHQCANCFIFKNWVSASDIAHLMIFNKEGAVNLAVDTHVYSLNQQFRLLGCVKYGQNNPFRYKPDFSSKNEVEFSFNDILYRSLITNSLNTSNIIIRMKNKLFYLDSSVETLPSTELSDFLLNLNQQNSSIRQDCEIRKKRPVSTGNSIPIQGKDSFTYFQLYSDFVRKLITLDLNHQGFIRSQLRGSRNRNVLIFNIGGNYRFCPRKGDHHLRNNVSILIDILHHKFAIRCKDQECDNGTLIWNKIE